MKTTDLINRAEAHKKPTKDGAFWVDPVTSRIPAERVSDYDKAKDTFVRDMCLRAVGAAKELANLDDYVQANFIPFIEAMVEQYCVDIDVDQLTLTLYSFDGLFKCERSVTRREIVNEKVAAVISLTTECADAWGKGANQNAKEALRQAFNKNKDGEYNVRKLRGLKKWKIQNDEKWQQAMELIDDCISEVGKTVYHRFWIRDDNDEYHAIPTSINNIEN